MASTKHHRLAVVLVLVVGVLLSSSICHAFKPSSISAFLSGRRATVFVDVDDGTTDGRIAVDVDVSVSSSSSRGDAVVRGGHGSEDGRFHLRKSDVLRSHGYLLIFLASECFLETVGVIIPLVGPTSLIPGFDPRDRAMKFVARFSAVVMLSRGLMEIEFASSEVAQGIFIRIATLMLVVTAWTMVEIGVRGIQWIVPALPAVYIVGFLLGK